MADLRTAKRRAQQTSTNQTIAFHVDENRYEIARMNDLDHSSEVYEHRLGEVVEQVRIVSASFGGSSTLVFDIYGRPSSAGTIVFNAGKRDQTIMLDASGQISTLFLADIAALEKGL